MLKRWILCLLSLSVFWGVNAQNQVKEYRYWYDQQVPGSPVGVASAGTVVLQPQLPTSSLGPGFHTLHFQAKDNSGEWSAIYSKPFFRTPAATSTVISKYEYWLDDQLANTTEVVAAPNSGTYNLSDLIALDTISAGFHTLHIRFRYAGGDWGAVFSQPFYKAPSSTQTDIGGYEYWIDSQQETRVQVSASSNSGIYIMNDMIPADSLSIGFHTLHIRFRYDQGDWGGVYSQHFYKTPSNTLKSISQYEYWVDENYDEATLVEPANNQGVLLLNEGLDGLSDLKGYHTFHIRFKENDGNWSAIYSQEFLAGAAGNLVKAYRYWFDEFDFLTQTVTLTSPKNPLDLLAQISTQPLDTGWHIVHFQFQDLIDQWSPAVSDTFHKGILTGSIYPHITINSGNLSQGQNPLIAGLYFSPNQKATLLLSGPGGLSLVDSIVADANGTFSSTLNLPSSAPSGIYKVIGVDSHTNRYAPLQRFRYQINGLPSSNLTLSAPTNRSRKFVNNEVIIEWADELTKSTHYPMTGIKRHYSYDIEYSTDNGSTWIFHTNRSGMSDINSRISLQEKIVFTQAGIGYLIRITDTFRPINQVVSSPFDVQDPPSGNIQAELVWDYSYPDRSGNPIGVAADSVARIFLKVSKKDPTQGPDIATVSIALTDGGVNTTPSALGKIMNATEIDAYYFNSESNNANSISTSNSNIQNGAAWFWYVAPEDFVGNDPIYEDEGEREVSAKITILYTNGTSDTLEQEIIIVRPPLMLVHGLGGGRESWAELRTGSGSLLYADQKFKISRLIALEDPGGSFNLNASSLVGENSLRFRDSFQGLTFSLRKLGYASVRVDYVGHSMGGVVIRQVYESYRDLFYRTGSALQSPYKNYEKGYINKLITVGSPHLGSPLANIATRWAPTLNVVPASISEVFFYRLNPNNMIFSFIRPEYSSLSTFSWNASEAVQDLRLNRNGFGITEANAHLIVSDLWPTWESSIPYQIPREVKNSLPVIEVSIINLLLKLAVFLEPNVEFRNELRKLINRHDTWYLGPREKTLWFLELYANALGVEDFLPESDFVVHLESQLSGQTKPLIYNSLTPSSKTLLPSLWHAFISPQETKDILVGNRINLLLNASSSSNWFDNIPSSTNKTEIDDLLEPLLEPNKLTYLMDSSKLIVRRPIEDLTISVGDILNVEIALEDTTHLLYLEIQFQNKTYIVSEIDSIINLNVQVNGNYLDRQRVYVEAIYDYIDSVSFVYDEVFIQVSTTSPLLGFDADPSILYLEVDKIEHPRYTAFFEGYITSTANFSESIQAVVYDTTIAMFDPLTKGFLGLSEGETYAIVSYRELLDTIFLSVSPGLQTSTSIDEISVNSSINSSLQLANFPNPFQRETTITYYLPGTGSTSLRLLDLNGRVMQVFEDGLLRSAGMHELPITLDRRISPGIYFCQLTWEGRAITRKMLVIK